MSFRRVGWVAAIALAVWLELSCGQVYRPVVIPVDTVPPDPQNFHAVFALATNVPAYPGTVMQIDVSGDTSIGAANMGITPTHAAILSNNSRVFVASAGSLSTGGADIVSSFTPAAQSTTATGLGTPNIITLPNVGPIDGTTGQPAWFCSYVPDFVTTAATTVYVANYGSLVENDPACSPNLSSTDSVAAISQTTNTISDIVYLGAGSRPVALTTTPNGLNLYVVNEGNNTVVDLSPIDMSYVCPTSTAPCPINVGATPIWAVSRIDNKRIYVLTQGAGQLVPIDTATNTVLTSQTNLSVGTGANFLLYDSHLNRLYVTNPTNSTVYVFSTTGGVDGTGTANDTPTLLATLNLAAGSTGACPPATATTGACEPVSITALPDGSRFYVASYEEDTVCSDPNVVDSTGTPTACMIPRLTVFDAASFTVKPIPSTQSPLAPSLSLLFPGGLYTATQYAVPIEDSCRPIVPYVPGSTRFRMFTTASSDSSHVYVSVCDAGSIADIDATTSNVSAGDNNTPDTLVTNVVPPFGAGAPQINGQPLPQNPIFLLTGQ